MSACYNMSIQINVEITMAEIKIFSTGACPICDKTKTLLTKWNIPYEEVRVDLSQSDLKDMLEQTNHARTVPQILVKGHGSVASRS